MFNTLNIEVIICTVRRGSYKFQTTFLKNHRLSELRIDLSSLLHSINAEGKKDF